MGQAIAHPSDIETSPAAAGSADDLLSQLAEQEIDRMLADADAGLPPEPATTIPDSAFIPPASHTESPPDAPVAPRETLGNGSTISADLAKAAAEQIEHENAAENAVLDSSHAAENVRVDADELAELLNKAGGVEADEAEIPSVTAPTVAALESFIADAESQTNPAPTAPAMTDAELDAAIADASEERAAPIADEGSDQNEFSLPMDDFLKELDNENKAADPASSHEASSHPPEQPTTAAERAALAPEDPRKILRQMIVERGAPVMVRILSPLNRPFAACPEGIRDTLGKIAILTTMNSLGILIYLMLFKR
jgi:hypothetical protein